MTSHCDKWATMYQLWLTAFFPIVEFFGSVISNSLSAENRFSYLKYYFCRPICCSFDSADQGGGGTTPPPSPKLCHWLVIKVEKVKGEVKTTKQSNMETSRVNGNVSSLQLPSLYDISLRTVTRNVITEQTSRSWFTTRGLSAVPLLTRSSVTVARGRRQTGSPPALVVELAEPPPPPTPRGNHKKKHPPSPVLFFSFPL